MECAAAECGPVLSRAGPGLWNAGCGTHNQHARGPSLHETSACTCADLLPARCARAHAHVEATSVLGER
eukprot:574921-Rhodomonas_salina.1